MQLWLIQESKRISKEKFVKRSSKQKRKTEFVGGDSFSDSDVLVNQDQRQIPELNQTTRIVEHGYQHRVLTVWVAVARTEHSTEWKYSRLSITRTFKGNRKKVRVIGSPKKIGESKVTNSFYCTVNILITFNCRNVK